MLTTLFQITLGVGVAAAAVVSGVSVDSGNKSWVVLPLAVVVGLALAALAFTRFAGFVVLLLGARSSIDVLQLSGDRSGTTGGNTVIERGIDPSSLIGVLFLASAMLWLAARSHSGANIRPSRLTVWLLAFWLAGVVSIIGSQNAEAGLLESLRIMSVVMMFVVLEQLVTSRTMMIRVLTAAYASLIFPLAYTLYGLLVGNPAAEVKSGFTRLLGTFTQSNDYARYLAFMIVFAVAIYPYVKGHAKTALAVLTTLAGVFLLLTLTLGAILGTAVGVIMVAALQRRKGLVIGFVTVVALATVVSPQLLPRVIGDGSTQQVAGEPDGNSLSWRLGYWAEVLPLANSNPVTGIGLASTQYETESAKQPHNDFLRAYVETGLLGLGIYVGMLAAFVGSCRRAIRNSLPGTLGNAVAIGALSCTVCFILESLAANVITNVVNLWYLAAFMAAAGYVARSRGADDFPFADDSSTAPVEQRAT